MIDVTLQYKYISLIGDKLEGFKRLRDDTYNFRCPICGDSETKKLKKRGYILKKNGDFFFYCHNCGNAMPLKKFIKEVDPYLYEELRKDTILNGSLKFKKKKEEPKIEVPNQWNIIKSDDLVSVSELPDTHPGKVYLRGRMVPEGSLQAVKWTSDFPSLVDKTIGKKYNGVSLPKEGIVFELKDIQGNVNGYQIRSIDPECPKSRRFVICSALDDHGLFYSNIDWNEPITILEGCTDSLFIENSIAVLNASLYRTHFSSSDIYFNDQEPRNKEVCKQIERCIAKGYSVVLLPHEYEGMDVNDLVKSGISPEELKNLFKAHTYKGIGAKIQFSKWRK